MEESIEPRIEAQLLAVSACWRVIAHDACDSALALAAARGTDPHSGGKSLLMKLEHAEMPWAILVVPGDGRIDGKLLRRGLGVGRYRFATPDELAQHTGLAPGAIPPFGRPIFDLALLVDTAIVGNPEIVFTPGRNNRSFAVSTADWLRASLPTQILPLTLSAR